MRFNFFPKYSSTPTLQVPNAEQRAGSAPSISPTVSANVGYNRVMERSTPPGHLDFGNVLNAAELSLVLLGALLITRT
jgi:hypothetical protein